MPKYNKYRGFSQTFPNRSNGLHLIARCGLYSLTDKLLGGKHGSRDIRADLKDSDGRTPLSYAAGSGHEAVVRLLVDRDDVEADSKDEYGQTPLSLAARSGHEAVVKLLVDRNDVKADSKYKYGQTPLSWAAQSGHEAVVRLLVDRDDVEADSKDKYGRTPLSRAAGSGHGGSRQAAGRSRRRRSGLSEG